MSDGGGETLDYADYHLLALSIPLSIADLDEITIGMMLDLVMTKNDVGYKPATQDDINKFFGW